MDSSNFTKNSAIKIMIHKPDIMIESRFMKGNLNHSVLILPPHPALKATLMNPVVSVINQAFFNAGFNTFRINYRGVGCSQGNVTDSHMHIEDAMSCVDCIAELNPDCSVKIAGYGYGAHIAINAAMRRPSIDGFIAVTPHTYNNTALNMLTPLPDGLIIHGSKDAFVHYSRSKNIAKNLLSPKGSSSSIVFKTIDACHTYKDAREELYDVMHNYISSVFINKKREATSKL